MDIQNLIKAAREDMASNQHKRQSNLAGGHASLDTEKGNVEVIAQPVQNSRTSGGGFKARIRFKLDGKVISKEKLAAL